MLPFQHLSAPPSKKPSAQLLHIDAPSSVVCTARAIIQGARQRGVPSMRRVQLTPASGGNPPGKKDESLGSRGGLGGKPTPTTTRPASSFAAASSRFNVPAKRRGGDNVDVTHGSTNTAPPPVVDREHLRDTAEEVEEEGLGDHGEAPAAVVCEVKEEQDLTGAVATIKDICEALDADIIGPAEADARLTSLSTVALLAAAPFEHPRDREAVFEVAHKLFFFFSFLNSVRFFFSFLQVRQRRWHASCGICASLAPTP